MRKPSAAWASVLLLAWAVSACQSSNRSSSSSPKSQRPTTAQTEPLSRQVARAAEKLHGKRFSGLLHFENESDAVFVSAAPATPRVDGFAAHTGGSSLLLPPGTQGLRVKLSSLLAGRGFPGDWALVGMFLSSEEPVVAVLSCEEDGKALAMRKVALRGGEWTAAMLDISALPATPRGQVTLELQFDQPTAASVRCDDLLLIDNRQTLVDASPHGWIVRRAGLRITCERKLRFNFGVVTTDGVPDGWEVEEANELRARFASSGETKALTVYADGRSMWDGAYKPLAVEVRDDPAFGAAHASPAEVAVPETMGRLNRNTPGDADNDGYNERLGAYQLQASGGRLEATLTPRSSTVPRPILQIAGLPEGKALITIECRLVEKSTRLPDGQLLIEVPARITRPTLITIRIQ
jgi:hypothetical protein